VPFQDDSREYGQDKLRLCPTCRSQISVFATKCKFCGEVVGRPRDEARQLTVDDLGGHSDTSYAVGGEVADAMESFRYEEMERSKREHAEVERRRHGSWLGRKREAEEEPGDEEPTPETEPEGLTEQLMAISPFSQTRDLAPPRRERVWTRKLAFLGAFIAAVLILYFGGGFAKARYDEYLAKKNAIPYIRVDNHAREYLRAGDLLGALKEAQRCVKTADYPEHREVADEVRAAVEREVSGLLNAVNWSPDTLRKASTLITNALKIDPDSKLLQGVKKGVDEEVCHYSLRIVSVDQASGEVRIQQQEPGRAPVKVVVERGDTVLGRFVVKSISLPNEIRLEDTRRPGRSGRRREFKVDQAGSITVVGAR